MIVCVRDVDLREIIKRDEDKEGMRDYVVSIMPKIYRHNTALVSNQVYYINTLILKSNELPTEKKVSVSDTLIEGIKVCGYLDQFVFIQDVERYVNKDRLYEFHERDK